MYFVFTSAKKKRDRTGGMAQSTSHSPKEKKTRVRIPPGYKVLESHSNTVVYNRLKMHCFVC
jgi:hypothetical protein